MSAIDFSVTVDKEEDPGDRSKSRCQVFCPTKSGNRRFVRREGCKVTDNIKTMYCGVGCGLEVSPPAQPGKAINRDSENPSGKCG